MPSRRRPSKRQRDNQKARAAGMAPQVSSKRRRPSKRHREMKKFARRHREKEGRGAAAREEERREGEEEGREEEALMCPFCGKNFPTLVGASQFEVKKYVAFERQTELLCENAGAWWMSAMGGEMWRRCHWWRSDHVDGDVNGWMCVLRRCTLCRKESHELRKCARRLRDLRRAVESSSSEESVF